MAVLVGAVQAGGELPPTRDLPARASLRFSGTSTLHDFSGTVAAQPFVLTLVSNSWSAKGVVLVGEMTTASNGRDRNMWKMFDTNESQVLRGEVKPSPRPPAGTDATLAFSIRDQTHDLPVRISGWKEDSASVCFHAEWDVSLKQFGLRPPSVMGVVRVGDRVHVEAEVTAGKSRP